MDFSTILTSALVTLVTLAAAAGGGVFGALMAAKVLREQTARELLSEALAVQALKEAWILEGRKYEKQKLSTLKGLPTDGGDHDAWLRLVEVRTVLDEAVWNSPPDQKYGFIEGRRTWIVRDCIKADRAAYSGIAPGDSHPALLSSRALEELSGWIERVASAYAGWTLSRRRLAMLKSLLKALAPPDRVEVLKVGKHLSPEACDFLSRYRNGRLASDNINWVRGLTRIYILLVVAWFLYWLLWIPLEGIKEWQNLAALTDDPLKRQEYYQHANLFAQWKELGQEMVGSPFASAAVILLPPILGYCALRLVLATIRWAVLGFKSEEVDSSAT